MSSGSTYRRALLAEQFHRARRQAAVESLLARLSGQSADLLSYDEVADKLRVSGQSPGGLRQIPVAAIVGSVGRYQDFTRTFLPRDQVDQDRWVRVGAAAPVIGDLPPIECYKIGDSYFVLDGNHRVSIARQQGVAYIDAYITEVRTRVPLPPGARPDDLIIAAEYADFLERTRLDITHQGVDMRVSEPGQYRHLENHIEAFRYRLESQNDDELPLDEAAARWYDAAYLPLVEAIREQGILRYFPGRTETDFFVWLARHRAELEHALGWQISPEVAVARLLPKAQASERASTRRLSGLRRLTHLVVPERPAVPPVSWAGERLVARYSDHLFANILLPMTPDRLNAGALGPALERAAHLSVMEGAQLCALVVGGTPTESDALRELRARLDQARQEHGLAAQVDVERGEPTQRAIELAYLNDLLVLDRGFNHTPADKSGPTAAAQRVLKQAHRPILFVADNDAPPVPRRALLVHDTRRHLDEAVFLAAYVAERWRASLVALLISNGHNTEALTGRIDDYLALHEVSAHFLEPVRPKSTLPEAITDAAGEADADLIILPGPGSGHGQHRHPRLDDVIVAVLRRWPGSVLVAS
jgi:nucleotide-binding universal stress UspA family protein